LIALVVAAAALATGLGAVGVGAAETAGPQPANATIVAAYPNPIAHGDPGEFVAVEFDGPANTTGWTITDGTATAKLPNRTFEGTVAFSPEPDDARPDTDYRVEPLSGRLLLADDGDRLALEAGNETVSTARYRSAPESAIREFETGEWRPVGATAHEPVRTDGGAATAFVLPDAAGATVEAFESAEERILLAGYTFSSPSIADALLEAVDDGVEVRVLLDGQPGRRFRGRPGETARSARGGRCRGPAARRSGHSLSAPPPEIRRPRRPGARLDGEFQTRGQRRHVEPRMECDTGEPRDG